MENVISMYFDHNAATKKLNDRFGFQVVGHLPEIAEVFGQKRGLMIALLRVGKAGPGSRPNTRPSGP